MPPVLSPDRALPTRPHPADSRPVCSPSTDHRIAGLTPDTLRHLVDDARGVIVYCWEDTPRPVDGGHGTLLGIVVVYLAPQSGKRIGEIGFHRHITPGEPDTYTVHDFADYRTGTTPRLAADDPDGLLRLLDAVTGRPHPSPDPLETAHTKGAAECSPTV